VDWAGLFGVPAGPPVDVATRFGPDVTAGGRLRLEPFEVVVVEASIGPRQSVDSG
jgi:hypothetical protein